MDSCGGSGGGIQVVVKRREVVPAVLPMQAHWLPMSNLDLLLPPLDVGVFFCYEGNRINRTKMAKKPEEEDDELEMVSIVKKGLGEVLVSFYSLAGEVVLNNHGEPELLCNNRGVDFVQAFVDMDLHHLDLHNPDTFIHANFVPLKKQGVLSVQVTEVKCGGLVIGCSFDHRVADAHSINMFLVAWADHTRSNSIHNKITPCYRRSLLSPRRYTNCPQQATIHNMYVLLASSSLHLPPADTPAPVGYLQSRIYHITAHEINRLQFSAGGKRSKLVSFSALLWKLLSRGAKNDNKICKLGIVVNGRKYCLNETYCDNYFGNVLSVPYIEATVRELKALPLSRIANLVHACVQGAANEDHFRGLIDWVEKHRPQQAMSKIYSWKPSHKDEVAVVVSSGQRFPVTKLDFGWGRPDFGSYHFPWGGHTGYVMPMPNATADGDWLVYMHLLPDHLDLVEKEAPHVFKPFVYI